MFESVGFMCGTKYVASASKTLSFIKPTMPSGYSNGNGFAAAAAAVSGNGRGSTAAAADLEVVSAAGGGQPLVAGDPQLN